MKVFLCFVTVFIAVSYGQAEQEVAVACTAQMCITLYDPVCCTYSDGAKKTFSNACAANNERCETGKDWDSQTKGECEAEPECNSMCPAIYAPVCCTYEDGTQKTYGSDCACEADNCAKKTTCAKKTKGACGMFHILPMPYPQYPPQIFVPAVLPAETA